MKASDDREPGMVDRATLPHAHAIHEMRNQLAVARANIEAFLDGKLAPTAARLESVLQALNELDGLIEDLRTIERPKSASVEQTEINVCRLLEHEYVSMEAAAAAKGVKLNVTRCAVPDPACMRFYGDPVRIGQIVKNLMLNAVRYTPSGGSVSVLCRRRADELEVTISDSGPGVAPHEAERIFEEGYRGSGASAQLGSGIGLSVVREFVDAHGGSVEVRKSEPHGASFVVRLPGRLPERQTSCSVPDCGVCGTPQ